MPTRTDGRCRGIRCCASALYLLGGVTIVAALLGYIGFARFMSLQIVFTGAILATMYIGFLSARAVSEEGAFATHRRSGGGWSAASSSIQTTLDQLALVVSIAINLLIAVIGLPLILFMWGFQPGDIQAWIYKLATEIRIGSVTISLTGILTGILVFVIGYFVSRWFQGWLDGSVMARGRVDAGVRNSIRTAVGYAGILLAALLGVSAAGIDLSNLALVAGALSLGIGFGLQNIVSNFVSGLILLAERPFKVGDWVVAGDNSGMVKKISVRATEIETFQRQTVIVPNSEFINSAVGNWTHRNKLGRIDVKISVAYGTDAAPRRRGHGRDRAQPPAGAEEPGAVRGVPQFRAGGAGVRAALLPGRHPQRQCRAERHPLRDPRNLRARAHRDTVERRARSIRALPSAAGRAVCRRGAGGSACRRGEAGR